MDRKVKSTKIDSSNTFVGFTHLDDIANRSEVGMKLPQTLKSLMKAEGVSAKKLAKETGIPLSTISSYTSAAKASYSPDHLRKLSLRFNVSVDYLLFEIDETARNLDLIQVESLFQGWLKVRIEKVVPDKPKAKKEMK